MAQHMQLSTGHERYGKTYKGITPNWEPGKKVHLVGHSMGGQTIRLMEEFLEMVTKKKLPIIKRMVVINITIIHWWS